MVREALPLTSATTPSEVAPSRKVTLPVGTPVAGATGLTVALSVTGCPTVEGFGVEVRLVAVDPRTKTFPVTWKRLVSTTLTPGPPTSGPVRRKTLVPTGLPMMACAIAGCPMYPAGGADAAGSHCRNGTRLVVARVRVKSETGGGAAQTWLAVKLIVPVAAAMNVRGPNGAG